MSFPTIAISMGDPAGIGPEVCLKALADQETASLGQWILVGDGTALEATGLGMPVSAGVRLVDRRQLEGTACAVGRVDAACGRAALDYVREAVRLCLASEADAMVTAPVNKEAVSLSGIPFSGHTEFIAGLCGATESRMLLVNDRLRVVHVTTHRPLREACRLDSRSILRTIQLGEQAMRELGFPAPRIAVCGLNPHAGENGLFGDEDALHIAPAVREARELGIACDGPLPADTVFLRAVRGDSDLVVAMYHDQGHIPMKLVDFERTVNVSLGLPIIRTSVDHGTAFDIAGKNLADAGSMKAAMRLAATMARNRGRASAASRDG